MSELIEKCAKAAGYQYKGKVGDKFYAWDSICEAEFVWNPIANNDDCFDLMVKADIAVYWDEETQSVRGYCPYNHIFEASPWRSRESKWRMCVCYIAAEKVDESKTER